MGVSGLLSFRPQGKIWYPLDRRPIATQSRSEHGEEENTSCLVRESNPDCPTRGQSKVAEFDGTLAEFDGALCGIGTS
jgi:hypothetical protein